MKRREEPPSTPPNVRTLALIGVGSALGAAASTFLYLRPANHAKELPSAWLFVFAVVLIALSSFCLLTAAAGVVAHATQKSRNRTIDAISGKEYVARYTISIRVSAIVITVLFAALTLLMIFRADGLPLMALCVSGLIGLVVYSSHVLYTSVRFTDTGFVAKSPLHSELRANYADVRRIMSRPGILRIEFEDGRMLKIRAGLGNSDIIISLLDARCPEDSQSMRENDSTG